MSNNSSDKHRISIKDAAAQHLIQADPMLGKLILRIGDIECNVHPDSFSFLVEEIIGQMLSNKMADVLIERFTYLCDGRICSATVSKLSVTDVRALGISRAKAEYIINFAKLIESQEYSLKQIELLDDKEAMRRLTHIKGVGAWTAKMYLLFVLMRPDILPFEDAAFMQGFKWLYPDAEITPSSVCARCSCWSPYSSIAARYLYRAVDCGFTKMPLSEL